MTKKHRQHPEQIGSLLEDVSDAVVATRPDGSIVYANPIAARWFDRDPRALKDVHFSALDADLVESDWEAFRARAADGQAQSRRLRTVNGAPVSVELRHRAVDGVDVWFCRPSTGRRGLSGSMSMLLFVELTAPQLLIDPADGGVTEANEAALAFYGRTRDDLVGCRLHEFTELPEDQLELELARVVEVGKACFRCHQRSADDKLQTVRLHAMQSWFDGRPRLHLVVHDVEDTLELNRELTAYRDLIDRLPVGVFRTTPDDEGRILMANPALADILGAESTDDLIGTSPSRFYARREGRRELMEQARQSGTVTRGVHALMTAGGRRIWAAISGRRVRDQHGRLFYEGAMEEITDRVEAEAAMRQAERIIENAREGIVITDADANIVRVNPSFTRITGYTEEDALGQNPRILSSGKHPPEFYRQMWDEIAATDHWQGEIWNRRKNGDVYPQWLTVSAIRDDSGSLVNYASVFTDMSEIHRSQAELERMQQRDSLTGLLNRSEFLRRLESEVKRAAVEQRTLCQVVLGIDEFTRINNVYSFGVGDDVLAELGHRFAALQERDAVLAGRTNSDEFALLFRQPADLSAVDERVATLIDLARQPVRLRGIDRLTVEVSAGVSLFPAHARSAGRVLGMAEAALGHAKKGNRGGYQVFEHELEVAEERRIWLKQELVRALDRHELTVAYQPIVDIASGRVIGAEALARWRHSEEGWIAPDEFIAVAEDGGLIDRLTFDLMETACETVAGWKRKLGKPLTLSFNISTMQLLDPELPQRVLAILDRTGTAPSSFRLELTESRLMMEIQRSKRCLRQLQRAGVLLSIDDFGTGFSSLAYLQEIRPATLKIDRRFIRHLPEDREDGAIASTIIAMAHALSMEVVAEGVETDAQLDYLARAGCQLYQGYLCSAPLSAGDFEALVGRSAG